MLKLKIYKVKIYRNDEIGWSDMDMTADESTVLQDEALPGHDEHSVEEESKIGSWFRATNAD